MDESAFIDTYSRRGNAILGHIDDSLSEIVRELRRKKRGSTRTKQSDSAVSNQAEDRSELAPDDDRDEEQESQGESHITDVRDCDLANYRESIKGEPRYILDILVAGSDLESETSIWEDRHSAILSPDPSTVKGDETQKSHGKAKPPPKIEKSTTPKDSVQDHWIRSVRINSAVIIRLLRQFSADDGIIMQQDFENHPLELNRPFSLLIHHHTKMKTKLIELRERLQLEQTQLDSSLGPPHQAADLAHVECYVNFVEDRLIPETKRWASTTITNQQQLRVRFTDLWYLFQPGDFVYTMPPNLRGISNRKAPPNYQFIRRVHAVRLPSKNSKRGGPQSSTYDPVQAHDPPLPGLGEDDPLKCFSVCLYHIEYDGKLWGAVSRYVSIPVFAGERDVTSLPVYPLHLRDDGDEIHSQAMNDGRAMVNLLKDRYGFYSGWSLISNPLGYPVLDREGKIKAPTHIDSDVLVDFTEVFNNMPSWRPMFYSSRTISSRTTASIGWRKSSPDVEWAEKEETNACVRTRGRVVEWDGVDIIRAKAYWSRDKYLHDGRVSMPNVEDFALIPRSFVGYSVWERKFLHLDIRSLQPKNTTDSARAFDQLQIGPDDKQMIKSLVHSHFQKKEFQAKHGIELQGQDLIRGKGKGLVILLHGVPGVGKTATAEAVAQKWQKPLFPITCGDLGITSDTVEKALNEIFRLAHLWDCVLLLDEADVFITQRVQVGDLQRNGLVSIFLRMLEYYNGILFLTTNRPGVLDEAVKSRVHLALKYDHLTLSQTEALFEFNMQRLKEIEDKKGDMDPQYRKLYLKKKEILAFAREHYEKSVAKQGVGRWNGRQIRNAFLIAASLAHYGDGEEAEAGDEELQKQLGRSEFDKVDKTTLLYDEYRREMFSKDDDLRAHQKEER